MILSECISNMPHGQPLSLAMGVFDGVHRGHQEVIRKSVIDAQKRGGMAGVLTFDPFPIQVLAPDRAPRRILASIDHKVRLLEELGVEFLIVVPFSHEFSLLTAQDFLDQLIAGGNLNQASVGEDWRFGKGGSGTLSVLRSYCTEHQIQLDATAPVMHNGERISSTRIRQSIRDNNLRVTAEMLGRPYSIFGKVVRGNQLGREIGFPTANLESGNELLPPNGVYIVQSEINGELVRGVANLGVKPTVEKSTKRQLEVHFLDYQRDLYDQELEVEFGRYLRAEQTFSGLPALTAQIDQDITNARKHIASGDAWF